METSTLVPGNAQAQTALVQRYRALLKPNERRSRWAFALLVFLGFTTFAVAGAVIGSAIIGYILAALFQAGKYSMSTCVLHRESGWVRLTDYAGGFRSWLVSCRHLSASWGKFIGHDRAEHDLTSP